MFCGSIIKCRLTHNQKHTFSSVMSIFGKDIAEKFIQMLTFFNANEPQILKSLTATDSIFISILLEIKKYHPWYLKFKNSAIFTSSISPANKLFWNLGMAVFTVFIEKLKTLPQKSLESSKNVLKAMKAIEENIKDFKVKLDEGLRIMDKIEKTKFTIRKKRKKLKDSKNFINTVKVKKFKQIDLMPGIYATSCMICYRTCHINCSLSDNADKKRCCAMDIKTGKCKKCDNHCDRNVTKTYHIYLDIMKKIKLENMII